MLQEIKEQLLRDREEANQITDEEARLLNVRERAKPELEEARQCNVGLRTLHEQQAVLYACLHE